MSVREIPRERGEDSSRMQAQGAQVPGPVFPVQLVGKVDVCEFGLTVGGDGDVLGAFVVEIVKVDRGVSVGGGGDRHDAGVERRGRRGQKGGLDLVEEIEVGWEARGSGKERIIHTHTHQCHGSQRNGGGSRSSKRT